jgi:PKD repeat protein
LFGKEFGSGDLKPTFDDFYIKKYVVNEPGHALWNAAEFNPSPPIVNFSANITSGNNPLNVQFTDLSSGMPTTWQWQFGDGSGNSTIQNPAHTYASSGNYTVNVTATNSYGSSTKQKVNYITVTPPPAFLDGWSYRKMHKIAGSPNGNQIDYQVRFTVWNTTGTDSGENVFLGTNVKADFSDIRFTTTTNTNIPYWVQEINSTAAVVWVNVPSIPSSGTQIYLYYGNGGAISESNGDATFLTFDDFSGASINSSKWTVLGGNGNIYQTGGKLQLDYTGSQSNDWWTNGRQEKILRLNNLPADSFEAVVKLESYPVNDATFAGISVYTSDTSGYTFGRSRYGSSWNNIQVARLGQNDVADISSTTLPAKLRITKTGGTYSFWADTGSGWTKVGSDYSDLPFNSIALFGKEFGSGDLKPTFDDFYIKKYVVNEPGHTLWTNL